MLYYKTRQRSEGTLFIVTFAATYKQNFAFRQQQGTFNRCIGKRIRRMVPCCSVSQPWHSPDPKPLRIAVALRLGTKVYRARRFSGQEVEFLSLLQPIDISRHDNLKSVDGVQLFGGVMVDRWHGMPLVWIQFVPLTYVFRLENRVSPQI